MLELKPDATLKDIQQEIMRLQKERGFSDNLMHVSLLLAEEVGEMLGQVRRQYVAGRDPLPEDNKSCLKHEIADVFIFLNVLATVTGVDLEDAWRSKERLNDRRDWQGVGGF